MNSSIGSCSKHPSQSMINCPICANEAMQKTLKYRKEKFEDIETSLSVIYAHIDGFDDLHTETYKITPDKFKKIVHDVCGITFVDIKRYGFPIKEEVFNNQITEQEWNEHLEWAKKFVNEF